VVTGNRNQSSPVTRGVERLFTWTRTRKAPMLNVVIAMVFLAVCLVGSLTLRTQMAQQAFEQTQVQGHIATLTQDVEDDQAKLDELQASLPRKAQDMGMVPQQGSIAIDLNGYVAANQKERR
jgi:septal ring factor EnvC (AmiA/AmiB activator)